ncbi:MAG TPA: AMP-binding protein, partial [Gaiellaceae bacterium]|nr:AMP-binding protein [Gaiellaceae bacterium]
MSDFVWNPTAAIVEAANLTRLYRLLGCSGYHELHRVSVEEPERFWPALVDDLGLVFTKRWARVLDTSDGIEWARWFVGGRVNVATNCVHKWAELPGEAAVFLGEDGSRSALTWPELSREVTQVAEALRGRGVEAGDRVAIFMPMSPAVAVASHACAHIGALQVPIFSGFAAPAVRARLEDSGAKAVITADWSYRRGKRVEML